MKRTAILNAAAVGAVAISLVGLGGLSSAQTPPPPAEARTAGGKERLGPPPMGHMMFGPGRVGGPFGLLEFDANGDGKLTRAEFDGALRSRFNEIDGNKDGFITRDEIREHRKKLRTDAEAARFQIMDTDHNGQISKSEFEAAAKARSDEDHPPMSGRGGHHGPGMGDPGGRPGPLGAGNAPGDGARGRRGGPGGPDNDARIDFAAFSRRASEAFNRADLNKDGVVTIAELQTLAKARR